MLGDVYVVFSLAVGFLRRNISILIPFYIIFLLGLELNLGMYGQLVSFFLFLCTYSFIPLIIRENENEPKIIRFKLRFITKAVLNTTLLLFISLIGLAIGSFFLSAISSIAPPFVFNILQFTLVANTYISIVFGLLVKSFLRDYTPVEAIVIALKSFYSNFLFYSSVILTGLFMFTILILMTNLKIMSLLAPFISPALIALQVTSLAFAFWQKAKEKDNLFLT